MAHQQRGASYRSRSSWSKHELKTSEKDKYQGGKRVAGRENVCRRGNVEEVNDQTKVSSSCVSGALSVTEVQHSDRGHVTACPTLRERMTMISQHDESSRG